MIATETLQARNGKGEKGGEMKALTLNDCLQLLQKKFPKFIPIWNDEKPEPSQIMECTVMRIFTGYVADLLTAQDRDQTLIKEIFSVAEYLIEEGDEDVQNSVCTCFLENLINITPEQIQPAAFVPFLGHKSRDYCKAWDEFTGVYTEGLWD